MNKMNFRMHSQVECCKSQALDLPFSVVDTYTPIPRQAGVYVLSNRIPPGSQVKCTSINGNGSLSNDDKFELALYSSNNPTDTPNTPVDVPALQRVVNDSDVADANRGIAVSHSTPVPTTGYVYLVLHVLEDLPPLLEGTKHVIRVKAILFTP